MIIYEATYCDCIHESAYATISVHRTREGAEKAIAEHKWKEEAQYYEMINSFIRDGYYREDYDIPYTISVYEDYAIMEGELKD